MTPERRQKIEELLQAALGVGRARCVSGERLRRRHTDLRYEVESLLASGDEVGSLLRAAEAEASLLRALAARQATGR